MIISNKFFFTRGNFFKLAEIISYTKRKSFLKKKIGVTELVFELNCSKVKISAILKRHCCHSNSGYVTFVKESKLFRCHSMQVRSFLFFIKYYLSINADQIPNFSIFQKTVLNHLNLIEFTLADFYFR